MAGMTASKDSPTGKPSEAAPTPSKPRPVDEDAAHNQRWREIGSQMSAKRQGDQQQTRSERADHWARAMVDNLNRNVMAEHEADLAALPPDIRASRTPEEWLATPRLEILALAANAKAGTAPAPGRKGWVRRAGEVIAASLRRATAGK